VRAAADPTVAAVALSGLALSQAMNSLRSRGARPFFATTQSGELARKATGSRSFNKSNCSGIIAPLPTWLAQLPKLNV
jgi:hypothetical protein